MTQLVCIMCCWQVPLAEVHIFQHSSNAHKLMACEVSVSDDGITFKTVGKTTMDLGHPGNVAAVLKFQSSGRFVKIAAGEKSLYYHGLGEVEIYSQDRPKPAWLLVSGTSGKTDVKIEFDSFATGNTLRVVRKQMLSEGSLANFPEDPDDGVKVYENKVNGGGTAVDKGAKLGTHYYYAAFVYTTKVGWSAVAWSSVSSLKVGAANPNVARDKQVTSNVDFEASHAPYRVTDGLRTTGVQTSKSAKVDDAVWIVIDLKKKMTVRSVLVYQTERYHMTKHAKLT